MESMLHSLKEETKKRYLEKQSKMKWKKKNLTKDLARVYEGMRD